MYKMSMTKKFTNFYGLQNTTLKFKKNIFGFSVTMRMKHMCCRRCVLCFSHFFATASDVAHQIGMYQPSSLTFNICEKYHKY